LYASVTPVWNAEQRREREAQRGDQAVTPSAEKLAPEQCDEHDTGTAVIPIAARFVPEYEIGQREHRRHTGS
jgi:hypothetical protein